MRGNGGGSLRQRALWRSWFFVGGRWNVFDDEQDLAAAQHAQLASCHILDRCGILSKAPRLCSKSIVVLAKPSDLDDERSNFVTSLYQIRKLRQADQRNQRHDYDTHGHQQTLREKGAASCLCISHPGPQERTRADRPSGLQSPLFEGLCSRPRRVSWPRATRLRAVRLWFSHPGPNWQPGRLDVVAGTSGDRLAGSRPAVNMYIGISVKLLLRVYGHALRPKQNNVAT